MPIYRENKPNAEVLMVSMRAMGYTFESAIADIIDNSVSANATHIDIKFPINPADCYIAICDDGIGMDSNELFDAMKYGSEKKGSVRDENDLGRFGLGMKSASLSQCRKLTVISKKNETLSAFIWDLDIICRQQNDAKFDWQIIECTPAEILDINFCDWLEDKDHGTVILWENFDSIEKATGSVYNELCKYKDDTADYLSLIFHRFLKGNDRKHVVIKVNNYELEGLDPFLESHNKTNPRREILLPIMDSQGIERIVRVQPFVLPFQKDLTAEDRKKLGGDENHRTKQGYYIYRNGRLIIWGTWFGRAKGELTKYARVKVDIPNSLDDIWGIDIKKQTAKIPNIIKNQLTKAVDEAMDFAVKAQTYRGRINKIDENIDYIWDRIEERENNYCYRINRESRIFELIKGYIDDATWSRIDMVLEEIENAIPYQQIYIDKSQNKVYDEIDENRMAELESKANILISIAMSIGEVNKASVIGKIFESEPFNKYPVLKEKMLQGAEK